MREAGRKGKKRMRYLGDDSQEMNVCGIEKEEAEDYHQEMENERKITGKTRRLSDTQDSRNATGKSFP